MTPITIHCDTNEIDAVLSELNLYIPKVPLKVRNLLLRLVDSPSELIRFEHSPAPVGAGLTVFLKPTDRLLDLLTACRTGNFENLIVKRESHITSLARDKNHET